MEDLEQCLYLIYGFKRKLLHLMILYFLEVIICDDPGQISNGYRKGDDFSYGKTVTYECKTGFKLVGDNSSLTCTSEEGGSWSSPPPSCGLYINVY